MVLARRSIHNQLDAACCAVISAPLLEGLLEALPRIRSIAEKYSDPQELRAPHRVN